MEIDSIPSEMNISTPSSSASGIDEALYSRQLYVLGADAMKKMSATNVLISGMGGLGVELAKNIILTGIKSLTIHDTVLTSYADLSANFYLNESCIGQNRALSCAAKLAELNHYVEVKALDAVLTPEMMSSYQVVVFTDSPIDSLIPFNEACRSNGTAFIACEARGVFGYIFTDFGDKFTVYDTNGEEPLSALITSITNDATGTVTVHEDKRHDLEDGHIITFSELHGPMGDVLNGTQHKVTVTGPHSFTIGDLSHVPAYSRNGYFHQIKQPQTLRFKSLKDSLSSNQPNLFIYDYANFERPANMHIGFQALTAFRHAHDGHLPRSYNQSDAAEFLRLCHAINSRNPSAKLVDELDERTLTQLSYTSRGSLSPVCAFLGGFAAQEVLKSCSGKFMPLFQSMYYDAVEALPSASASSSSMSAAQEQEYAPMECRYDGQIAVFGQSYQEKLSNLKVFIVGSGALGCEFLKQYALMGVGTGAHGKITVTDMDVIETSNLSRQFLFKRKHVGTLKSQTAAAAASEMNPSVHFTVLADKVAPETEHIFDQDFWEKNVDVVVNALDNVAARAFVDSKCVEFRIPLLESGTLGTKASVQVVLPFLTESYSNGRTRDPPETSYPSCTIKNFPNAIEHTIQWARETFAEFFAVPPSDVNSFSSSSTHDAFMKQLDTQKAVKRVTLERIHESLVSLRPRSFEDCVYWARLKFEELFNHKIKQLLYTYPLDFMQANGSLFWSGQRRPATVMEFNSSDTLHLSFIVAAANLRAQVYGLSGTRDEAVVKSIVDSISAAKIPAFVPNKNFKIESAEKEKAAAAAASSAPQPAESAESVGEDDDRVIEQLMSEIPLPSADAAPQLQLNALEFEKDDDSNFHMDFITAASNVRARSYTITEADKSRTKLIAGKIIPAMITTTALTTGLVGVEFYKLFVGGKKLEDYKSASVNLALPVLQFVEPVPVEKQVVCKAPLMAFSFWDRYDLDFGRDVTLQEMIDYLTTEKQLEVSMISCGTALIYMSYSPNAKRLAMPVSKVLCDVTKEDLTESKQQYLNFVISCDDAEGNPIDGIPIVRYRFRGF